LASDAQLADSQFVGALASDDQRGEAPNLDPVDIHVVVHNVPTAMVIPWSRLGRQVVFVYRW
jgi:hypothetical protein